MQTSNKYAVWFFFFGAVPFDSGPSFMVDVMHAIFRFLGIITGYFDFVEVFHEYGKHRKDELFFNKRFSFIDSDSVQLDVTCIQLRYRQYFRVPGDFRAMLM